MKYLILLFLLIPTFFISRPATAMIMKIDSVYADSCYGNYVVPPNDSAKMFFKRDSLFGQLSGNGPTIDMAFKKYKSNILLPIKTGSIVLVWGKKDLTVDSSAGQAVFVKVDADGAILGQSKPFILEDGLNSVTAPNDYSFVEISLASPLDAGSKNHSKSYLVDAIALLQDTTTPVSVPFKPSAPSILSSYPNPFIASTTIRFTLALGGETHLAIIDGLGRETDHINAGYLENGTHEIPLAIRTPGFYFVRVFINGEPIGYPLKITSR